MWLFACLGRLTGQPATGLPLPTYNPAAKIKFRRHERAKLESSPAYPRSPLTKDYSLRIGPHGHQVGCGRSVRVLDDDL